MYKSPIDILTNDIVTAEENAVIQAVVKCGINVDKDELVKALAYDRGQYEKGYADAKAETDPEMEYRKAKTPFFMTHRYIDAETKKEGTWVSTHCPVCFWNEKVGLWDSMIDRGTPFCSRCGQKIEW